MTRREFILAVTAAVAGVPGAAGAVPATTLRRLPLGSVRPRGWMLAQMQQDLEHGFAGRLDTLSPHVANDLFANRLAAADGQLAWWDAESRGNWLWGYTLLAHLADAPQHRERAAALVRSLRATQDADGYLGIHAAAVRYRTGDVENGELWAQSRALLTLLAHHELTGDAASLDSARRAVDLRRPHRRHARPVLRRCAAGTARGHQRRALCSRGRGSSAQIRRLASAISQRRLCGGQPRRPDAGPARPRRSHGRASACRGVR